MRQAFVLMTLIAGVGACAEGQTMSADEAREVGRLEGAPAEIETYQLGARVTNVGATCAAASNCQGSAPTCLSTVPFLNTPVPGGYCSAKCTSDPQCGTGGACPLGALVGLAGGLIPDAGGLLQGADSCLKKCTANSDCRGAGFTCAALPLPAIIPGLMPTGKFCLPDALANRDGGIPIGICPTGS